MYGVPDEQVGTEIDGTGFLDAKLAAMAAHATQIAVAGRYYALSNNVAQIASGLEYYALLSPAPSTEPGDEAPRPTGREDDLFAGIGSLDRHGLAFRAG